MKDWEILSDREIYSNIVKLSELKVRHKKFDGSNSETIDRIYVHRGYSAATVMYDPLSDVLLFVKQFRTGVSFFEGDDPFLVEIPAGMTDADESAESAIIRECSEETGYEVTVKKKLAQVFSSPGIYGEKVTVFLSEFDIAKPIKDNPHKPDEHEDLKIITMSKDEALRKLESGFFRDMKTVLGLQGFFRFYN